MSFEHLAIDQLTHLIAAGAAVVRRDLAVLSLRWLIKGDRVRAVTWLVNRWDQPLSHSFSVWLRGPAGFSDKRVELIHLAALYGAFDTLRWLLAQGANPNARTHRGYTPVVLAAFAGHADSMALLVSKGADPNSRDPGVGTTLDDFHTPTAPEVLRIYHGQIFQGNEHAHRMAEHLDGVLPDGEPEQATKRPRL